MFYLAIIGEYEASLVQVLKTGNKENDKKNIEEYFLLGYTEITKEQFDDIENAIKLPEPFNIEAFNLVLLKKNNNK
jgi:hypothetical protein